MVLPASPADDAPATDAGAWLNPLKRALRLSDQGVLLLVDNARQELLGELVRALLPAYPELEVHTEAPRVVEAPPGAVLVLVPRAEDADWLNLNRPVFAHRALRVILFCDAGTAVALAQRAVDFFDWISHRVECPSRPPRFAVAGIRCALAARAPGITWLGGNLEASFAAARPRGALHKASAGLPFSRLVAEVKAHPREWIAWTEADGDFRLWRVRWALAEAGRQTRTFLVEPLVKSPGWWPVHGRVADMRQSRARLEQAGARFPGRMAALIDLEPEAVDLLHSLLSQRLTDEALEAQLMKAEDPGAVLGLMAEQHGLLSASAIARMEAPPPALRSGGADGQPHSGLRRAEWDDIKRRIGTGELSGEAMAWWSAWTIRVPAPERYADRALTQGARQGLEAMLRAHPSPHKAPLLAGFLVTMLGDADAAEYWGRLVGQVSSPDRDLLLGMMRREQGQYTEAEALLRQALAHAESPSRTESAPRWAVLQALASVVERQGRYEEAEALAREAVVLAPPSAAEFAQPASTLASVLMNQGKYSEAEEILRYALATAALSESTPLALKGAMLQGLGSTLRIQGSYVEAATVLRSALAAYEMTLGPDSMAYGHTLGELAVVLRDQEQGLRAEELMRRSLGIQERVLGSQHPFLGLSLSRLAIILHGQGKSEEAEETAKRAAGIEARSVGESHPWYGNSLRSLAIILIGRGRYTEAEALLRQDLEIQQRTVGVSHPAFREALLYLGITLARQDKGAEALVHIHRALELSRKAVGDDHMETAQIRVALARVQNLLGDPKAQETAQQAVRSLVRMFGEDHPAALKAKSELQGLLPEPPAPAG